MVPLIDIAYQGFVTGDLDKDAEPLRKFVEAENHQLVLIAQSHSKNLTLYGNYDTQKSYLNGSRTDFPKMKEPEA